MDIQFFFLKPFLYEKCFSMGRRMRDKSIKIWIGKGYHQQSGENEQQKFQQNSRRKKKKYFSFLLHAVHNNHTVSQRSVKINCCGREITKMNAFFCSSCLLFPKKKRKKHLQSGRSCIILDNDCNLCYLRMKIHSLDYKYLSQQFSCWNL